MITEQKRNPCDRQKLLSTKSVSCVWAPSAAYRYVPEDTIYAVTFREVVSINSLREIKSVTVLFEKNRRYD
jgi:hypothetical protein